MKSKFLVTFLCCQLVVDFSVDIRAVFIGLSQISFFFLNKSKIVKVRMGFSELIQF